MRGEGFFKTRNFIKILEIPIKNFGEGIRKRTLTSKLFFFLSRLPRMHCVREELGEGKVQKGVSGCNK